MKKFKEMINVNKVKVEVNDDDVFHDILDVEARHTRMEL